MDKYVILCYGDSNTHGTIARWNANEESRRYDCNTRWPCVLQRELGDSFHVIEEGLPCRTTIYTEQGEKPYLNGLYMLEGILQTHKPIDLVILMLGTNDMKLSTALPKEEQGRGIETLAKLILERTDIGRDGKSPEVLIVSPPVLSKSDPKGRTEVYQMFHGEYGIEQSMSNPKIYLQIANRLGCHFFNSQDYVSVDLGDGVHITAKSHILLGKALANQVMDISRGKINNDPV